MKKRFWLLGSPDDLTAVGRRVSDALGVRLAEHESGYRGGVYLRSSTTNFEEVIVQTNFEDEEGYLVEAGFANYPTLVYVTQSVDADPLPAMDELGVHVLRIEEL